MSNIYINGVGIIGSDFDKILNDNLEFNNKDLFIKNILPDYKKYFNSLEIRRISNIIKNGIISAKEALKEAENPNLDAIIVGSGFGCINDSEKFLLSIIENGEQYLSPTSFILSTHNTVAGQIALYLNSKAYNFTYVQDGNSFESALLDGFIQIKSDFSSSILIGGIDEMTDYTLELYKKIKFVKKNNDIPKKYFDPTSNGFIFGEGANFFVLENINNKNSYSELINVELFHSIENHEVINKLIKFLKDVNLSTSEIDLFVLGINYDKEFHNYYDMFLKDNEINSKPIIYYKPLSGEYFTANSFGFWIANNIIKHQKIPSKLIINDEKSEKINYILMYNQYRGNSHSFILLKKIE